MGDEKSDRTLSSRGLANTSRDGSTRYQLQARAVGMSSTGRIVRDDTRVIDRDDLCELRRTAARLVGEGFTAWLFERSSNGFKEHHLALIETHDRTGCTPAAKSLAQRPRRPS